MAKKAKDFETIKKELLEKGKKQGELTQEEIVDALSKLDISSEAMDDFYEELNNEDIILINANHVEEEEELDSEEDIPDEIKGAFGEEEEEETIETEVDDLDDDF